MRHQIKFGIRFAGKWDYTYSEVSNFIEGAENIEPQADYDRYVAFLNKFLNKEIKPNTLVDYDLLVLFHGDVDNRAQVDYREGHYEERSIIEGGKYFDEIASKMNKHLQDNKPFELLSHEEQCAKIDDAVFGETV